MSTNADVTATSAGSSPAGVGSTLSDLGYNLTDNALAWLRRAVTQLNVAPTSVETLSFAVVDLAVAVEVLLKARLARHDWTLIAAKPATANQAKVAAGTQRTVGPDEAIERLELHVGIDLKTDKHDERIRDVARFRNQAVHYATSVINQIMLEAALGLGLDFVLWFLDSQFRGQGDAATQELVEDVIDGLSAELGRIKQLTAARMATIEPVLAAASVCVECPQCRHSTLTLSEDGVVSRCAYCLWAPADGPECAQAYAEVVLRLSQYEAMTSGGEWPLYSCPNCAEVAFVEGIEQDRPKVEDMTGGSPCDALEAAWWGCFHCGVIAARLDYTECARCGALGQFGTSEGTVCSDCWAEVVVDAP